MNFFACQLLLLVLGLVDAQVPSREPISNDIELPTESGVSNVYVKPTEKVEEEEGFIDSIFGRGTQARIITSVSDWVTDKAKTNPGCVERFICESYKAGESMSGFPYIMMQVTNAAVSFMVAEMFDQSIDIQEITRAARYGRTVGTCQPMTCDVMDGQLRTLGDYLSSVEEFLSSIVKSVSNSINIGKK